jgi:hypothetical protein
MIAMRKHAENIDETVLAWKGTLELGEMES